MTFQKNNKLGKGRKKGSVNFVTLEKRGLIEYLKEEGKDRFLLELQTLEGKDYCDQFTRVIEIAFPKQARVEQRIEGDINHTFGWKRTSK